MDATGRAIVAERAALADTLDAVGPRAPTLAGSWTAADLAAHLVALDAVFGVPTFVGRAVVTRSAVRLNDVAARYAEKGMRRARHRGFAWAVARLRRAPPRLLLHPLVVTVGLFEVFVHHEDVRRARDAGASRDAPAELAADVPWLLRYQRKPLEGIGLRVKVEGLAVPFVLGDGPTAVIEGSLAEVVLWLAGRRDVARVRLTGDGEAVARAERAPVHV